MKNLPGGQQASPWSGIARRFTQNPLLHTHDITPSHPELKVECLLNPGVFRLEGKIWLVLRVAERPVQQKGRVSFPILEDVPTLDALAEKVGPLLKGVVLYKDAADAGFPVAITLAGLKDGVPVPEAVLKAAPHLAALPVLDDLRGRFQDRLIAQEWAIAELLPATSKNGAFSLESANDHYGLDLAIARRMFVYKLAHTTPEVVPDSDKERQRASKPPYGLDWPDAKLVSKILAHLDPVSPVWGWGGPTEAVYLRKVSQSGAFVECSHVPNMSFHAQVKPLRPQLRQKKHLAPDEVKLEDKVYLAFMVNEGDTAKSMVGLMNFGSWLEPERGKLPINWGISPYLCEQFILESD